MGLPAIAQIRAPFTGTVLRKEAEVGEVVAPSVGGGLTRGAELFYILNNLYPGDPVTPGAKYKIVVVQ